jgi:hypothetical protein
LDCTTQIQDKEWLESCYFDLSNRQGHYSLHHHRDEMLGTLKKEMALLLEMELEQQLALGMEKM